MSNDFLAAVKQRRTFYAISKETTVSDERIEALVGEAVLHTPSSFNSQSARVVVLLKEQHDKLWDLTTETLRQIVPADNFGPTADKMKGFRSGYGTVLFFEDQAVIQSLQEKFAAYSDNFPIWSQQSSGMLQFVVWTALEQEGLGASLQHYNPLIDEQVRQEWGLPGDWKLIAQMPFGQPAAQPGEKAFQPLESRLKVYK
ncbi:nitroreductase family protein [Paenibacillus sp. ACRRX]|uniref:nitroreductase family protein n=1 Tax=Paenibacillus sp. ACRRX TaxID=2918206 RepID=UPI001EF5E235|nr:nitroreductase family protein [Paenibacillus sp. ACRRX]MCG7406148.1 nitroreductase family protein [Paenibacillus sp. ACRRX]